MSEPPLFDAFEATSLLPDEVPGHLESIAVRGEQLVVGTSDGQLLLYQISPAQMLPSSAHEPPTCVMSARRSLGCGRNAVNRIELCSATGTGFALCDATVNLFELHDGIQTSGALPASKGTTALCLDAACPHVARAVLAVPQCIALSSSALPCPPGADAPGSWLRLRTRHEPLSCLGPIGSQRCGREARPKSLILQLPAPRRAPTASRRASALRSAAGCSSTAGAAPPRATSCTAHSSCRARQ